MKELIKIDESGKITSKELYEFLRLDSTHYTRWTKQNIEENPFAEEGKEYEVLAIKGENPQGGRPSKDYKLSIPFAKKLCMLSKSERGEQARNYFLEVEKRYLYILQPKPLRSKQSIPRVKPAVKDALDTAKLLESIGVKPGIAQSACFRAVEKNSGVDLTEIVKCLPAAEHEIGSLNATGIAERLNLRYKTGNPDAQTVNRMLIAAGLIEKSGEKKQPYRLTEKGKGFGEFKPYTKGGHSGYDLCWNESVVAVLTAQPVLNEVKSCQT